MSSCEECPEGKYTDTEGATECSACKTGYVAPERGMSNCQACQPVGILFFCFKCLALFAINVIPVLTYMPFRGQWIPN